MRMRKTICGKMDVEVKCENAWQLVRAWLISLRFVIVRGNVGLTINGNDFGSIRVVVFPKFRFIRAVE